MQRIVSSTLASGANHPCGSTRQHHVYGAEAVIVTASLDEEGVVVAFVQVLGVVLGAIG